MHAVETVCHVCTDCESDRSGRGTLVCDAHGGRLQAVYSTGCAPTLAELETVLARARAEAAPGEDAGLTKKDFKALMLQMQRSVPREQEVLKDLETLRGELPAVPSCDLLSCGRPGPQ